MLHTHPPHGPPASSGCCWCCLARLGFSAHRFKSSLLCHIARFDLQIIFFCWPYPGLLNHPEPCYIGYNRSKLYSRRCFHRLERRWLSTRVYIANLRLCTSVTKQLGLCLARVKCSSRLMLKCWRRHHHSNLWHAYRLSISWSYFRCNNLGSPVQTRWNSGRSAHLRTGRSLWGQYGAFQWSKLWHWPIASRLWDRTWRMQFLAESHQSFSLLHISFRTTKSRVGRCSLGLKGC